jgi:chromosome segregation ATPase
VVRQRELNARLEQLRADLVRAEHAVVDAAAEVRRAERRQRNAQHAAEEAAAARDRAVARVEELARRVD